MARPPIADLEGDFMGIRLGKRVSESLKVFSADGDNELLAAVFEFDFVEISLADRAVVLRRVETELSATISARFNVTPGYFFSTIIHLILEGISNKYF